MALGDTTVEVIIKNISNRKMTSVMEAMLKLGDTLFLLFNPICQLFCRLVQQVHELHCTRFHFIYHTVYQHHQIIVGKHSDDTDNPVSYTHLSPLKGTRF